MTAPFAEPPNPDAAGVFFEWATHRTCGESDSGSGIFLSYQLTFRSRPLTVGLYLVIRESSDILCGQAVADAFVEDA